MKKIFILFVLLVYCLAGCKTTAPAVSTSSDMSSETNNMKDPDNPVINYSDQITWLLGYFPFGQMTRPPHSDWYLKGFDTYQPNAVSLEKLMKISKDGLLIKIVMGSWCPDSRREVPRFMRVLEHWQFPIANVTFIGVDDAKLSPVGEYINLNIERVPTFIIYENNFEVGRIIENPKTSLEQDIVNILTKTK